MSHQDWRLAFVFAVNASHAACGLNREWQVVYRNQRLSYLQFDCCSVQFDAGRLGRSLFLWSDTMVYEPKKLTVTEIWQSIEGWLEQKAPHLLDTLNPPAARYEIWELEAYLGVALPEDFRESCLRHDGQVPSLHFRFLGGQLLSLSRIRESWDDWRLWVESGMLQDPDLKPDDGGLHIVNQWWSPGWIPVTWACQSDFYCIDMNPGPLGRRGQVIELFSDNPDRPLIAYGFRDLLGEFANRLIRGDFSDAEHPFVFNSIWS